MSNVYTPNAANNPSAYTMAVDGDAKPVASMRVSLEGLADKTAHIDWPAVDVTKRYPLASRSIRKPQTNRWAFNPAQCSHGITISAGNMLDGLIMTTLGAQAFLPLDIPDLCMLTALDVVVQGAPGHVSVPTTTDRFNIAVYAGIAQLGNAPVQFGSITYDPTASGATGTYQFEHLFTATGFGSLSTFQIDKTITRVIVVATNEKGANAVAGLRIVEIAAIYTVTSIDPGAA